MRPPIGAASRLSIGGCVSQTLSRRGLVLLCVVTCEIIF